MATHPEDGGEHAGVPRRAARRVLRRRRRLRRRDEGDSVDAQPAVAGSRGAEWHRAFRLARPRCARRVAATGYRCGARGGEHAAAVRRAARLAAHREPVSLAPDAWGADVRLGRRRWTRTGLSQHESWSLSLGAYWARRCAPRKSRTNSAMRSAAVSRAKWPASSTWTCALGTSRRYASGSDSSNERSCLPQITNSRGWRSRIQACHLGYASTFVR